MKIYHEYAPTMEDFMENMIVKGKVNDDLTVIYDEFLEPESVSRRNSSRGFSVSTLYVLYSFSFGLYIASSFFVHDGIATY